MSGLIGGLIATGIAFLLRRRMPRGTRDKSIEQIVADYRWHNRFCGAVFVGSLLLAILIFKMRWVASNDWRVLAFAFGGGAIFPVAAVIVWIRFTGRGSIEEFSLSLGAGEGMPPMVMHALLVVCGLLLGAGLMGFVFGKGF